MDLEYMVKKYSSVYMSFIISYQVPESEREDILQESYIALYRLYDFNMPEQRITAILSGIVKRKCADFHRRHGKMQFTETIEYAYEVFEDNYTYPDPLSVILRRETFDEIRQGINKLNKKYREIIILHLVEERTVEEVCKLLNISKIVFYNRFYRAKLAIKKIILKI